MCEAILSLGSNLGNRLENLKNAIKSINSVPETKVLEVSNFYETMPVEVVESQNNYINCCIKISTSLNPYILMGICLGIESSMGRKRLYKHCSRTIDIDILAYETEIKNEKNLTLPHPRMTKRAFVLIPLKDICQDMKFRNIDFKNDLEKCDINSVKIIK